MPTLLGVDMQGRDEISAMTTTEKAKSLFEAPYACFWPAALGLALEGCAGQYRALEAVAGIDVFFSWEALASRTFTLLMVLLIIALTSRKRSGFVFERKAWSTVTAILFSLGLACFFSARLFVATSELIPVAGDIFTAGIAMLYLLIWFDRLFAFGIKSTLLTIATSLVMRSVLQVLLLMLQPTPSMLVITLLPLASLPLLHLLINSTQDLKPLSNQPVDHGSAYKPIVGQYASIAFVALLAIVFLVNLVNALLNSQFQAGGFSTNITWSRQYIDIVANFIVGVTLFVFARTAFGKLQLIGFLLVQMFIAEAALYTLASLAGATPSIPVLLTICSIRMLDFVVVFPAFVFSEPGSYDFRKHTIARAMCSVANLITMLIVLSGETAEIIEVMQTVSFVGLSIAFIVFAACVVDKQNFNTAFAPAESEAPEEPRHAYFRDALDAIAQERNLTATETSVLRLVARGMNAGGVSKELVVSVNTAKTHIRNIYSKTGVHSQQELIALAHRKKDEMREE